MKTLEEYMALPYRMEITPDHYEGGYVVGFPDLPGCLTCADTLNEAIELAIDAKREWLFASMEDGYPIPEPTTYEQQVSKSRPDRFELSVPEDIRSAIARESRRNGVSVNQFCVDVLSRAVSV